MDGVLVQSYDSPFLNMHSAMDNNMHLLCLFSIISFCLFCLPSPQQNCILNSKLLVVVRYFEFTIYFRVASLAQEQKYECPSTKLPQTVCIFHGIYCSLKYSSDVWRIWVRHDDVIKWKYFPRYWAFVREIHRWSPHKGQWRGALMFSLVCAWTNGWANNRDACDLRRHCAHYDVNVMSHEKAFHILRLFLMLFSQCSRH